MSKRKSSRASSHTASHRTVVNAKKREGKTSEGSAEVYYLVSLSCYTRAEGPWQQLRCCRSGSGIAFTDIPNPVPDRHNQPLVPLASAPRNKQVLVTGHSRALLSPFLQRLPDEKEGGIRQRKETKEKYSLRRFQPLSPCAQPWFLARTPRARSSQVSREPLGVATRRPSLCRSTTSWPEGPTLDT